MPGRSTPAGSAQSPVNRLIDVLSLGEPAASLQHTYIKGESLYFPTGHVYGGQVIAQSVVAASETVPEGRLPQSIHGYFIAAGDIHQDVLFDVENLRDGKSFSSRRVNATQRDGAIFTAITSFQEYGQDGFQFHDPAPDVAVQPEDLPSVKELMRPYEKVSPLAAYYAKESPFDIRHVTPTVLLGNGNNSSDNGNNGNDGGKGKKDSKIGGQGRSQNSTPGSAHTEGGHQLVWMKADGNVDASQTIHRALLALGCDQIMMEPILRRAGISFTTKGISFASIDHSMWWYDNIDMNDWILFEQDTPVAGHGRGLATAKVYSRDGKLVAAMVQEAMIRVPQTE